MNRDELVAGLEWVRACVEEIVTNPEATEDDLSRADDGLAWCENTADTVNKIDERAEKLARVAEVASRPAAAQPATRFEPVNVNVRTDPFDGLGRFESTPSEELRGRAELAIERALPREVPDSTREAMTALVRKPQTSQYDARMVNFHTVFTAKPEYVDAFRAYVAQPMHMPSILAEHARAAMSLTAAAGGVLVPQWLDSAVILTNAGSANSVRQLSRIEQVTVDQADFVTSAGATATWTAEATAFTDGTPAFQGPTITNHKLAAWLVGSWEVLADSGWDGVSAVIADAFDRAEESAFTTGTGSSQPYGLISRLSGTGPQVAGTSGDAGAADFIAGDVYAVYNALPARWVRNSAWQANKSIISKIRQFGTSDTYHAFLVDFGAGMPSQLLGEPLYENAAMDSTIVSGSNDDILLLGDHSQYIITDRVGTSILYVPVVMSGNAPQTPTGQAGWAAYKRVGADVVTSNAFKLLRV